MHIASAIVLSTAYPSNLVALIISKASKKSAVKTFENLQV
jgi:hypothetical protein